MQRRIHSGISMLLLLLAACTAANPLPARPALPVLSTPVMVATASPTLSSPAAPGVIPSKTPTLEPGSGGSVAWPNQNQAIHGLALDDQYIYFSEGPGSILRQSLDQTRPFHPQTFTKIQYPAPWVDGVMRIMPRLLKDHVLYSVDSGDGNQADGWTIRAKNTVTLAEKTIAKGSGGLIDFTVDGDTMTVSFTTQDDPNCAGKNVLETIQLSSGQTHELDHSCSGDGYSWWKIALSGERLLALKMPSDQNKEIQTLVFDLKNGHSALLSTLLRRPEPFNCTAGLAISGAWVACSRGETKTSLDHLTTHQHLTVSESLSSDSELFRHGVQIQDHWVYWTGASRGAIYDLARNKLVTILTPRADETICEMAMNSGKVAWLTIGPSGYKMGWMDIPQDE